MWSGFALILPAVACGALFLMASCCNRKVYKDFQDEFYKDYRGRGEASSNAGVGEEVGRSGVGAKGEPVPALRDVKLIAHGKPAHSASKADWNTE